MKNYMPIFSGPGEYHINATGTMSYKPYIVWGTTMNENSTNQQDIAAILNDPVFMEIFLPLYQNYKLLNRDFDKKVIDKDIETLRKKFETIATAKERRKSKS